MDNIQLIHGDCLIEMKNIPDKSVDCILCDLPYGTTDCKWDIVIPFDKLWDNYNRIIKDGRAIILFGSEPFSSYLRMSNIDKYCYDWVYNKRFGANFVLAKKQPIKVHENIMIFSKNGKMPMYIPLKEKRENPIFLGGNKQSSQKAIQISVTKRSIEFGNSKKEYKDKYPTSILNFNCREDRGYHPTQKPVRLLEYLIKTYTNEGDTVLDNCMGSGSCGVAAVNTGRKFIGIELDENYFNIAKQRIDEAIKKKNEKTLFDYGTI